jgi:phosphoglycolate phosphatase
MELLLDLDGTLTDPGVGITRCVEHALSALGRPVPSSLTWCVGPPLRGSFAELLGASDPEVLDRAIGLYRERFVSVGMFENVVYPGVAGCLNGLRERGHRLRVVTSKPRVYARRILDHFALSEAFISIHGPELSGEFAEKADLIRHVLSTEQFEDRPWMVGDRRHDIEAAHANDLPGVGVLWGYGSREELEAAGADKLMESMEELCEWACSPSTE